LIEQSHGSAIAILNNNKPTAYLVPAETYEKMMELLSDIKLSFSGYRLAYQVINNELIFYLMLLGNEKKKELYIIRG